MPADGGGARYHEPRDRSPVPAVLVGALVVVTLVSAQVSVAGGGGTAGTVAAGQEQAETQQTGQAQPDQGQPAPDQTGLEQTDQAEPTQEETGEAGPSGEQTGPASPGATDDATDEATDAATEDTTGLPRPVEVTFEVGSDEPAGDAEALLRPLVEALLDDPSARVRVVGHASPSNDPVLEEQLSLRRAETVLDVLADEGLPAGRADVVAAGSTQAGRSVSGTDRRVTVEVVPG
ncbi:OmpA family protein [Aquipuribacter hungaricus]|uniref:OmpA family protein n=1 Tax=Aquipuribacter hungaricus TaxID=545624 RepID=A0ABV7WEA4_9MICO